MRIMKLSLEKTSNKTKPNQTLVVALGQGPKAKKKDASNLVLTGFSPELKKILTEAAEEGALKGKANETVFFRNCHIEGYDHLMTVGLGALKDATAESLRQCAAAAYHSLNSHKAKSASFELDGFLRALRDSGEAIQVITEGLLLAEYDFDEYIEDEKRRETIRSLKELRLLAPEKANLAALKKGFATGETLAECVNFSRRLGDLPGNLMYPEKLAEETKKAARGTGLKVTVWDKARIKKERMGGLYGVALGSGRDPRFIIMEYKGAAASQKPVCFVGKGLTFDSGGISIKPSTQMDEMKYDMCGGANVIGAMLAIARLKLKVNVLGLVPASENMPGEMANKPGDILTARNGKTVEVLNTDAEGRLILMDALSYASEKKPKAIFDAATLTGAMVVALGNSYTGYFTRDDKVAKAIEEAAKKSGEWVWRMPLCDHHVSDMKGRHADLSNISSFRGAGSSTAAAFLEQFVAEGIPWAHFDVAGTAWAVSPRLNYCPSKGASGVMVRTFVELAQKI